MQILIEQLKETNVALEVLPVLISFLSFCFSIISLLFSLGLFQISIKTQSVEVAMDAIDRLFTIDGTDRNTIELKVCNIANRDILWKVKGGYICKGKNKVSITEQYITLKANTENIIKIHTKTNFDNEKRVNSKPTAQNPHASVWV